MRSFDSWRRMKRVTIDYSQYNPSWRERVVWMLAVGAGLFLIGMIFYKHVLLSIGFALLALAAPKLLRQRKAALRREQLIYQFQQALHMLSAAIAAGKSLESAMTDTVNDLRQLFPDPRTMIVTEWESIVNRLNNGVPIEAAFAELARRSDVEDIRNFAEVLAIGKRQGGNLVEVLRRTVQIMSEKIDIQRELGILLAKKRWESRLLCFAPIGFVAVLGISSSDYMAPLYAGAGRLVMTVALGLIAGCWWVSKRLMDIEI